jgi:hypothetical protein
MASPSIMIVIVMVIGVVIAIPSVPVNAGIMTVDEIADP